MSHSWDWALVCGQCIHFKQNEEELCRGKSGFVVDILVRGDVDLSSVYFTFCQ